MYTIALIDKIGFSYYDVVDICEVIDLGDTYNLITTKGDIFVDKDNANITINNNVLQCVEYTGNDLSVFIDLTVAD